MKLAPNTSLAEFMRTVQSCRQDVFYTTPDGDRLNLKSALSQFLFAALQGKAMLAEDGKLECQDARDRDLLRGYILEG